MHIHIYTYIYIHIYIYLPQHHASCGMMGPLSRFGMARSPRICIWTESELLSSAAAQSNPHSDLVGIVGGVRGGGGIGVVG